MTPEPFYLRSFMRQMSLAFRLEYKHHEGEWWMFLRGRAVRPLSEKEVAWHTARNHKPFVPDGIDKNDPRWWDDPVTE